MPCNCKCFHQIREYLLHLSCRDNAVPKFNICHQHSSRGQQSHRSVLDRTAQAR